METSIDPIDISGFELEVPGFSEDNFKPRIKANEDEKWEEVAAFLLRHNLLLTALEFHIELVELGKELPKLRDFFSNPGNFEKHSFGDISPVIPRTSSIQTFDSLDFTRYSDDADRQVDERVAVLEFELRKARDTISALRTNLTIVAESDPNSPENAPRRVSIDEEMKPHEKRVLNFLVNEYLLKNNYKLTSITFSDENEEQDFDDWDDVGLNVCRPPELPQLYRQYGNKLPLILESPCQPGTCEVACQTEDIMDVRCKEDKGVQAITITTEHINRPEELVSVAHNQSVPEDTETRNTNDGSEYQEGATESSDTDEVHKTIVDVQSDAEEDGKIEVEYVPEAKLSPDDPSVLQSMEQKDDLGDVQTPDAARWASKDVSSRQASSSFVTALRRECFPNKSELPSGTAPATSYHQLSQQLSSALPVILPSVLLAKRGELVPLILSTICLQTEAKERDQLIGLLFNLIKKPEEDERQLILGGMDTVARTLGAEAVEAQLLPQCWEQIGHKYIERRLLVAECCGVLLPYLSEELCGSLVLSMLQQMLLEEKEDAVRAVLIRSLAALLPHIQHSHKYTQAEDLLFVLLEEESGGKGVEEACLYLLLPSLAFWALQQGAQLRTSLLTRIMQAAQACLQCCQKPGPGQLISEAKGTIYVHAIQNLCPFLFVDVISEMSLDNSSIQDDKVGRPPPSSICALLDVQVIHGKDIQGLLTMFDSHVGQEWFKTWPALDWLLKSFIPWVISMVERCDPSQCSLVQAFCSMLHVFCNLFGTHLLDTSIKPLFLAALHKPVTQEYQEDNKGRIPLSSALVPTYTAGVLAAFEDDESKKSLVSLLEDVLVSLALQRERLDSLNTTFTQLCAQSSYQDPLLSVLWKGVVHGSALVRACVAQLFDLLVPLVDSHVLQHRIMPALITLASDPDMEVRASVVPALGSVFEVSSDCHVQEKVRIQLQSFLDDPSSRGQQELLIALIKTFSRLGTVAEQHMRDEFILPRLAAIAVQNNQSSNEERKQEVAVVLFEAYSALSACSLSDQMIGEVFLPGLMCLQQDLRNLPPSYSEALLAMVHDLEARLEENKPPESPGFGMGSAAASMEDMKNRVSKIFGSKATVGRPNLPSIFQLRKKP